MYSKTPYQLRFEIFKQSCDMLPDKFVHHVNIIYNKMDMNGENIEYPESPTLEQVLQQAEIINNFVSETK